MNKTTNIEIGVIGAGTMGNGIAHVFSLFDYNVVLVDLNKDILDSALKIIDNNMNRQVNKGLFDENKKKYSFDKIKTSTEIENLSNSNLVIEAVKEDLNVKSNIFKCLDSVCNNNTILASNTSSISINKLADSTNRQDKVIGMHFMNPVPMMKLIEVINGKKTSKETTNIIVDISKSINKVPIECNDGPGFVSNRILMPMINEATICFSENVATAQSIDSIMKLGMGHPMGPLMLADLIGIDICVNILHVLHHELKDDKYKPSKLLIDMVNKGELGKKTGKGFYNHEV